jgi:predicted DNA-binding protein
MPNPFIGVRIPPELDEAIAARMRETGQSKSGVVIAALETYLGMSSYNQRLETVEERVSALEEAIAESTGKHSRGAEEQEGKAGEQKSIGAGEDLELPQEKPKLK